MLNIIDLEKRWVRYKIKLYIPHVSILLSLVIIGSVFFIFSNNVKKVQDIRKEPITVVQIVRKPVAIEILQTPVIIHQPIVTQKQIEVLREEPEVIYLTKGIKLSPSLDFMRKMQNSVQPNYKNTNTPSYENTQKVEVPRVQIVKQEKVAVIRERPTVKKITIRRQNTQNDIHDVIARFKKNNNPALSLFVAKKYYELQNYKLAYNYALITNKINKEIESSWIIFSKSLVKIGQKDKAISTLKKYIKQSHSSAAQILLDEIYSEKFR